MKKCVNFKYLTRKIKCVKVRVFMGFLLFCPVDFVIIHTVKNIERALALKRERKGTNERINVMAT